MGNVLSEYGNLVGISDSPNKADKVSNAVSGNFAGLDANGNLTDSGFESADFEPALTLTTSTLTGNPIVVEGKKLAVSTKITFDPIQSGSGDPSPSNVRAISGYDKVELAVPRKNLFNKDDSSQVINANVSATYAVVNVGGSDTKSILVKCVPNKTYTISKMVSARFTVGYIKEKPAQGITVYDISSDSAATSLSVSTGDGAKYIIAYIYNSANDTATLAQILASIQVEEGTVTEYEPYNPITDISQPLPETVYGGTLDVESGELVVDKMYVSIDGNNNWELQSRVESGVTQYRYRLREYDPVKKINENITSHISNYMLIVNRNNANNCYISDSKFAVYQNGTVFLSANIANTAEDLKTLLNTTPLQIVCTLADEYKYTIHLTPAQVRLLTTQSVVTSNGSTIELVVSNAKVASIEAVDSAKESVDALGKYIEDHPMRVARSGYGNGKTFGQQFAELVPYIRALSNGSNPYKFYDTFLRSGAPAYYPNYCSSSRLRFINTEVTNNSIITKTLIENSGTISAYQCTTTASGTTFTDITNDTATVNLDLFAR